MSQIKAVLWDMDGVLIDSEWLVQEAFIEVMTRSGVMDNAAERYKETVGMNRETTLQWYMQFVDSRKRANEFFIEVGDIYHARMDKELRMKPGVVEALKSVKAAGIPQMVVTSSKYDHAVSKMDMFDLGHFFADIVGGDQVTQGKPHPEPYLTGAKRLMVNAQNALVIEDSINGVKSGLAAGAMVVHVPDLIPTDPEWQGQIFAVLDSLEFFPTWLSGQGGVERV